MKRRRDIHERFWEKVDGGDVTTCWVWTAGKYVDGYGSFKVDGKHVRAHRWAYEELRADIPEGLDMDHLCRMRACVNPWHLEPVTHAINCARGDGGKHMQTRWGAGCTKGHPWTAENTYIRPGDGRRRCKTCARAARVARRERTAGRAA